jgi:hypothetical protein
MHIFSYKNSYEVLLVENTSVQFSSFFHKFNF